KLDKIRRTKNEEIKKKLLDALRDEEEARMLHEKELEEQVPATVERSELATEPREAPKPKPEDLRKLPKHYQPEEQEQADIEGLTEQEEKNIEEAHEKG